MPIPSTVFVGAAATLRLQTLDLTADELLDPMRAAYSTAAGCTDHDPRSLPGTLVWGKGIGHLRDIKATAGWTPDRASNFETTVHPSNTHAVAVAAGTPDTGRVDATPRTKTPKGPATHRAVSRNKQLPLGQGTTIFAGTGVPIVSDENRETWILLHYFDRDDEEIRLELSCPDGMDGKQITAWRERIILPSLPFSEDVEILDPDTGGDFEIEIDVPRRAS